MKKLLVLSLLFIGCESKQKEFDRVLSEMTAPVILIGKKENVKLYSSIVVQDGSGRVATFSYIVDSGVSAEAIADSRKVGDTLKTCK